MKEIVCGAIIVDNKHEFKHEGITLSMEGSVILQMSSKSVGIFDAFYNSVKVKFNRSIYAFYSSYF